MTVAAYIRHANEDVRQEQLTAIKHYCQKNGLDNPRVFEDGATSGNNIDRSGIRELIHAALNHEFEVILVRDRSRITRKPLIFIEFMKVMEQNGIRVIGVEDRLDSAEKGNTKGLKTMGDLVNMEFLKAVAKGATK